MKLLLISTLLLTLSGCYGWVHTDDQVLGCYKYANAETDRTYGDYQAYPDSLQHASKYHDEVFDTCLQNAPKTVQSTIGPSLGLPMTNPSFLR